MTDEEILAHQETERKRITGTFKEYYIFFKNGSNSEFGHVKAWFAQVGPKDNIYIRQLDIPGQPSSRWSMADISDIMVGDRLEN